MNNWNELNSYAQTRLETRRQEAEEWRLARLVRNDTHGKEQDPGAPFSLPQILISLVARVRVIWLGA